MKYFLALLLLTASAVADTEAVKRVGEKLTINVQVTDGTAPFQFRWLKDGAEVAKTGSAFFVVNAVKASDAGVYTVEVSNSAGSVTSDKATIRILIIAPGKAALSVN